MPEEIGPVEAGEKTNTLTPSSLRCLLAIRELAQGNEQVASISIARKLGVKPPSVWRVVELLRQGGLIEKESYGKIELTNTGWQTAERMQRRVRTLRAILSRQLGLNEQDSLQGAMLFVTSMEESSQQAMIAHVAALKGGDPMMPLNLAPQGEESIIRKISGTNDVKKHLSDLGFVVGGTVSVVTQTNGNLIVNVKESRIAISCEMAQKIIIR